MREQQSLDRGGGQTRTTTTTALLRTCGGGFDSIDLRRRLREDLRRLIAFDAYCINTADPATLLITGSVGDGLPPDKTSRLFEIEYTEEDVNKLCDLAAAASSRDRVAIVGEATHGKPETSARMREIFLPLGLGRELRAALLVGESCWGYVHLLRNSEEPDFSAEDAAVMCDVSPHIASALRLSLLHHQDDANDANDANDDDDDAIDAPGVVLLDGAGAIEKIDLSAKRWLAQLGDGGEIHEPLPHALHAVAASLADGSGGESPWCRLRARSGEWLIVHGSRLVSSGLDAKKEGDRIAIVIERARAPQIAPLLLLAHGFTPREREVSSMLLRGRSNEEIADDLGLSLHTVKDHLKAIYEKAGVKSRGELVHRMFVEDYAPRITKNASIGPRGFFRK